MDQQVQRPTLPMVVHMDWVGMDVAVIDLAMATLAQVEGHVVADALPPCLSE